MTKHEEYLICQKRGHRSRYAFDYANFKTCEECGTRFKTMLVSTEVEENVPVLEEKDLPLHSKDCPCCKSSQSDEKPVEINKFPDFDYGKGPVDTMNKINEIENFKKEAFDRYMSDWLKRHEGDEVEQIREDNTDRMKRELLQAGVEKIRRQYPYGYSATVFAPSKAEEIQRIHTLLKEIDRLKKLLSP